MDWKEEAEHLKYDCGMSWRNVAVQIQYHFPGMPLDKVMEKVRGALRSSARYKERHGKRPEKKTNPRQEIIQNFEPETLTVNWKGNKDIRFAIVSDTHINSKYTQLTYLHQFYDECRQQGIKHVYHAGDIDEGEQMRPGHQYECYTQGADEHVDEICRVYPCIKGITTHFITGNHDASTIKRCGYNIGHSIAVKRPDMEYLGAGLCIDTISASLHAGTASPVGWHSIQSQL